MLPPGNLTWRSRHTYQSIGTIGRGATVSSCFVAFNLNTVRSRPLIHTRPANRSGMVRRSMAGSLPEREEGELGGFDRARGVGDGQSLFALASSVQSFIYALQPPSPNESDLYRNINIATFKLQLVCSQFHQTAAYDDDAVRARQPASTGCNAGTATGGTSMEVKTPSGA
ncbi:hypothetical protein PYCCODRAFT_632291 [Trametes coccinea BRFM310]|uniref:Uncharacterized protein n=1 Tax=Trametes coccinea (strain BRFM310) TaxID=1353009 RepID=A0A1Y2J2L6_TRAC3|nr:hypothetical protein PYCCODRAFT_632291 [Trametes coccinea BRFM310]